MTHPTSIKVVIWGLLLIAVTACSFDKKNEHPTADIVLTNAYVYTLDTNRRVEQALAIRANKIIAVGDKNSIQAYIGPETNVHDLKGRMVLPGLHDSHIHALATVEQQICDFRTQAKSLDEMVPFLKACLDTYPVADGQWFIAVQWAFSQGNQPSTRYPTLRAALDAVSSTHPIILWADDGHHAAVNSMALANATTLTGKALAINKQSLASDYADFQPLIGVDARGEPNGSLTETARGLVGAPDFDATLMGLNIPPEKTMPRVAKHMASSGITSLQDALVGPEILERYKWLEENNQMTFRVRTALFHPAENSKSQAGIDKISNYIDHFKKLRNEYSGLQYVRPEAVKLFADGVLEGNPFAEPPTLPNAAMLDGFKQPIFAVDDQGQVDVKGYVDTNSGLCKKVMANKARFSALETAKAFKQQNGFWPKQCEKGWGILEHGEQFIHEFVSQATEAGFHIHIHALADKAVRVAVDAFEKNKASADKQGLTQSLAHLQMAHPKEQKRIGELGIFTVFTYVWATPDPTYEMMVIPFIDHVHGASDLYNKDHYYMQNAYPVSAIKDAGGILVGGSDAPVGSRDPMPFANIQQAVTRHANGITLNEQQRISIDEALASYTINSARLFGHDQELGSIETGKIADLIVIDQNIIELAEQGNADKIGETQVLMTVFDGNVVYQR